MVFSYLVISTPFVETVVMATSPAPFNPLGCELPVGYITNGPTLLSLSPSR
jgi:hypothetical protein